MCPGRMKSNKCPTCGKVGQWFGGAFGPFCSKRCRLIDLGK
ncbi:MAG TPA: DNA gyrase inhibitor YacG, partial [Verrucomicrobiae bacterium]|nr:DNA gyrase inhibitor YacG [Verrucomicrobiae bacterium]